MIKHQSETMREQGPTKLWGRALLLIFAWQGIGIGIWMDGAQAQWSPNCQRNGKSDYCAITPLAGATTENRGTSNQGGYKHQDVGEGINLTFFYLD